MSSPYRVRFDLASIQRTRGWEWALRFVFGGAVTLGAGLVARAFGPSIGGLFLAFPSILPASLTLVARKDGRDRAVDEARGAAIGALGLGVFAAVASATTRTTPAWLSLTAAGLAWIASSVALWAALAARRLESD